MELESVLTCPEEAWSMAAESCGAQDLLSSRASRWVWGLPLAFIALGLAWPAARASLWTLAFLWAGAACVINAVRCRRVHCFFTGPLYLGLGVISALIGLDVLAWRWRTVGILFVVGTLAAFAPELVAKRYVRHTS